jgi:hypothetical protein
VKVYSRGEFGEMFDHVKLHNTAYMMAATPAVIHSVLSQFLSVHKQVRLEIKLNREELGELLANFDDPFIRKERRG